MSKNVVKVGNHWGSKTADWVVNKTEPPMTDAEPVAVSGPRDTTPAVEEKPRATRTPVSPNRTSSDSGSTDK